MARLPRSNMKACGAIVKGKYQGKINFAATAVAKIKARLEARSIYLGLVYGQVNHLNVLAMIAKAAAGSWRQVLIGHLGVIHSLL